MTSFLDVSFAFDTTDHHVLLQTLEDLIGMRGAALGWFKSYLADRSQFVNVNKVSSMHAKVSHRVTKGSVLGLMLFTLYILPLGRIQRKHSINCCYCFHYFWYW